VLRLLAADRINVLIHSVCGAMYQLGSVRCIGGSSSKTRPVPGHNTRHPSRMCRFSDSALYCVRMKTLRRPELMQFGERNVDDR